jgi:hypothetical protein
MVCALLADRTEKETAESSGAARADDEQVGIPCCVDEGG